MAKQVLRLETIHSGQAFAAKMRHNYRIGNVPNADPAKKGLNRSLIDLPSGMTYNSFYEHKLKELPYYKTHEPRKNAIRGFEVMLSYGTKNPPKDFDLNKWAELNVQFLKDEFGEENIASAVLHMDEGVPHIHAVFIPIKDGRLNASAFFPDRSSYRDLHRRYHEYYMKDVGLEEENRYMHIEHQKVGKFYANINMALEKDLPGPEAGESLENYAARANEFYKQQMLRVMTKDHQIETLRRENEALTKANKTAVKMAEQEVQKIMDVIGSLENAEQATRFYNNFMEHMKIAETEDPEFAQLVMVNLRELSERFGPEHTEELM